jgi:competence CoiA-like predicted nuclease
LGVQDEKHIADVKTPNGLVVEFQHSAISAEEKLSRETFYKNMIWVVDGLRLKHDFSRFKKDNPEFRTWPNNKIQKIHYAEFVFPKLWLGRTVPVIFDWGYGPEPAHILAILFHGH